MKPLNKKDRSRAFFKVVGLSVISCVIVLILGFTYLKEDSFSNNKSKNALGDYMSLNEFQKSTFEPAIEEVKPLFSGIPNSINQGEDITSVTNSISVKLEKIKETIDLQKNLENKEDNLNYKQFYLDIYQAYEDLRMAYIQKGELTKSLKDLEGSQGNVDNAIAIKDGIIRQNETKIKELEGQVAAGGSGNADLQKQIEKLRYSLDSTQQVLDDCNFEKKAKDAEIDRLKKNN